MLLVGEDEAVRSYDTTQCVHRYPPPSDFPSKHAVMMIFRLCSHVKNRWTERDLVVFVDNCYGEFVEEREPCHVGADLIAGSLIKNPGGTVVKSGEGGVVHSFAIMKALLFVLLGQFFPQ